MAFITWKDSYSVNVKDIDTQHKKLIDMINSLHDSMKEGKGKEAIGGLLKELITYTKNHFAQEEQLFDKYGYFETLVHKRQHQDLVSQVESLQNSYLKGETIMSLDVMEFLKKWLNDHILGSDKKYSAFLNGKGVN